MSAHSLNDAHARGVEKGYEAGFEAAKDVIRKYMVNKRGALLYGLQAGLHQLSQLGDINKEELC